MHRRIAGGVHVLTVLIAGAALSLAGARSPAAESVSNAYEAILEPAASGSMQGAAASGVEAAGPAEPQTVSENPGPSPTNAASGGADGGTTAEPADAVPDGAAAAAFVDPADWADDMASNLLTRAVMLWGDPRFTVGDRYEYAGPAWWLGSFQEGGLWLANAWHVPAWASNGVGRLNIDLDREQLASDLWLDVVLYDAAGAALHVDLYDTNDFVVVPNLYSNLLTGCNAVTLERLAVPLRDFPAAVGIRLQRDTGEVVVYATAAYENWDALQGGGPAGGEAQLPGQGDQAWEVPEGAGIIYVDSVIGDDAHDGQAASASAGHGPKRTVTGALHVAADRTIVQVAAGVYHEAVWKTGARTIYLRPVGKVTIR